MRGGLKAAAAIAAWLWVLGAVVAVLGLGFLRLQGWHLDVVATASMSPTIPRGSLALTSGVEPLEISVGDVVVYRGQGEARIMHRVIEVIEHDGVLRFRTQGDLNEDPDPGLVHQDDVEQGLRWSKPELGRVLSDLEPVRLILWFVVLPFPLLLVAWRPRCEAGEDQKPTTPPSGQGFGVPSAPLRGGSTTAYGWFIGGPIDTTMAPTRAGK
ncbi:MAG: signal peptidase I [Actinomycetia bacterium]|nr:signal peptidase I [Actinomycetes bacterium]